MAFSHVTVKIDGQDLAEQKLRPGAIVLSQPMWDHHWFSVECLGLVAKSAEVAGGANEALDGLRTALGKQLVLEVRWGEGDKAVFHGLVTSVRAARSHLGAYSVVLEGHSPTVKLDGPPRRRIWLDSTTQDVIGAITGDHGDICQMDASTSRVFLATFQQGETDFAFLQRLCQREGLWAWYDGEHLKIADTPSGRERKLDIRGEGDGTLDSFSVQLRTGAGKHHGRAWDTLGDSALSQGTDEISLSDAVHAHFEAAMSASDTIHGTTGDLLLGRHPGDASGLEADLEVRKQSWVGGLVSADGSCDDPGVSVGGLLEIGGMSADDGGRYIVTSVVHRIQGDGSGYRNDFTCVPEEGAAPPLRHEPPHGPSLWGAIVRDTQDPDGLGRVKVEFHHSVDAGSGQLSPWLRVAQGHSGETWGAFALPELEDEVVVAALGGDQEDLVVLGSLPNGSSADKMGAIKAATDAVGAGDMAEGMAKVFLTKSGNQILIMDQSGAETIEISNPGGENLLRLTMDGGPKIEVNSSGDVAVKAAGGIELKSDGDVTIDAGGSIELKSGSDTKIDASGKADVQAGSAASVKGMEVKVEGGGTVTCNPAGVEVKGTLIRLN